MIILFFKMLLADLGWRKLTAADVKRVRERLKLLYRRSDQVDPFKDEESEYKFCEIAMEIKYLRKVLDRYYLDREKEPASASQTKMADSF